MRVAIVIDDLDRRRGGLSEWCWQFVTAAARRGYVLHIVAQGFGLEPLPAQVSRHKIARTGSRQTFAEAADIVLRELKPDVVHDTGMGWNFDFFQPHGGSYDGWLRRRLDMFPAWLRAVKRPVDALMPRHRDFAQHWGRQCAFAKESNSTVLALSNMVADDLTRLNGICPEQIQVVYNGVDCGRFSPLHRPRYRAAVRQSLGVGEADTLLLLAAHNFRLKGVPELLHVAAKLRAEKKTVHVAIAGGKRLELWRRQATRLNLDGRVTFLGPVADLVPYYAAADAYIHPTYYDPCSLVLLEAAASGLPIVTTRRCNGAIELFREDREILTIRDPTDDEALYECVEALFDARLREQLGTAAHKVAMQHTMERNTAAILRQYERRANRRAAA